MRRRRVQIAIVVAIVSLGLGSSAWCKSSLLDPGTLLSTQTINDVIYEKYSDGLTTQISPQGYIQESKPSDDYSMGAGFYFEKESPDMRDQDISMEVNFAFMHGHRDWNDSRVQSRLRQFSTLYLRLHEPTKAEPLARLYLHSQQVLHVEGEPLAFAQSNLGEVETALGKFQVAIPLLRAAADYYEKTSDHFRYCKILFVLAQAFSQSEHANEGKVCLATARKAAKGYEINSHDIEAEIKTASTPVSQNEPELKDKTGIQPKTKTKSTFEELADADSKINKLWERYQFGATGEPTETLCADALDELSDIALLDRNWSELAKAASSRCEIYERGTEPMLGDKTQYVGEGRGRIDCYAEAALAFIHLDKLSEAKKYLQRAADTLHQPTCLEYITIALLEIDCEDRSLAKKYAELSESLFTNQYMSVYPAKAVRVWNILDQPERATLIKTKTREMRAAYDLRMTPKVSQ